MSLVKSNKREDFFPSVLSDFFDYDKFFDNRWSEREFRNTLPAVNIRETDKQYHIEFAAPGFAKTDFKIDVDHHVLTVSAEKKKQTGDDNKRFTRQEFSYTTFSRSFTLPETVDTEKIDANYNEGLLTLRIPKKEELQRAGKKQIRVD